MQNRTYGQLYRLITSLIGTGGDLASAELIQLRDFINRRFQQAFDESPVWQRYLVPSEERDIVAVNLKISGASGDSGAGYDSSLLNQDYTLLGKGDGGGAEVLDSLIYSGSINNAIVYNDGAKWVIDGGATAAVQGNGKYQVSTSSPPEYIESDTEKKTRVIDVSTWTPSATTMGSITVTGKQTIQYEQTGKTTIGEFNRIHRKQSFRNESSIEYDFFVDFDGANILNIVNSVDKTAFVTYKKEFTVDTDTPSYSSTKAFPSEFFNFTAHAVYADFLRVQNRQQEAIAEEGVAQTYLALELEKIDLRSNNNTINKRFSTYVNRQSR